MAYKRPPRTKEQQRVHDLKEISLLTDQSVTLTIKAAMVFFGCSRRTINRYLDQKLLNFYRFRHKGRVKVHIRVDRDFFETGSDIVKFAGRGKGK